MCNVQVLYVNCYEEVGKKESGSEGHTEYSRSFNMAIYTKANSADTYWRTFDPSMWYSHMIRMSLPLSLPDPGKTAEGRFCFGQHLCCDESC